MADVTLREITDSNRAEVLRLVVTPEQSDFVDGVASSLEEAGFRPTGGPLDGEDVYVLPLQ